jgi:hypothetical protein
LRLKVAKRKVTADWFPRTVLSQNPAPNTQVEPGSIIAVAISIPPKCDPSYPDFCIKPFGPDLDCADIPYRNFRVVGNDYYHFDGNHDGEGCET